ncbi:putative intracellular mobility A [Burkholderia pseudomallei MSHR435]|nr:putative intracellular mobility A [Burkholderia pseudomallei MSHR435]
MGTARYQTKSRHRHRHRRHRRRRHRRRRRRHHRHRRRRRRHRHRHRRRRHRRGRRHRRRRRHHRCTRYSRHNCRRFLTRHQPQDPRQTSPSTSIRPVPQQWARALSPLTSMHALRTAIRSRADGSLMRAAPGQPRSVPKQMRPVKTLSRSALAP